MTASLPVPHEPLPDDPEESSARAGDGRIVEFVKNPRSTPVDGAPRTTTPRPKRPAKPRAPRTRTPKVAPPDPGPPPPLPPEFADEAPVDTTPETPEASVPDAAVPAPARPKAPRRTAAAVPPKPEVSADVAAAAAAAAADLASVTAATPAPEVAVEAEVEVVEAEVVEPEVEAVEGAAPAAEQPDPRAEGTLVAEPEPEAESEAVVEPEVEVAAAPEPVAQEPVVPEPVVGAVPEPEATIVEPDPIVEPEIEIVVEPEIEPELAPAAAEPVTVEPEPAAVVEAEVTEIVEIAPEHPTETELAADAALVEVAPELFEAEATVEEEDDPLAAVYAQARADALADDESAALVLRGVSKAFGETRAVDSIDLTVPAGTFYGLVGPNGAGKTTTLSMIAGLLAPDRGAIRIGGVDATADPVGAKKMLGVLPDRLRTFDRLTGRQLLYYYGVLRGLKSSVVESRTADLARAFDLTDALGRVVTDYSAGMLKKVMLAGAMIHSPRVLVLDEPFEAVDPVSSAVILDILSAYVSHGGTVILSSHGMDLVERVCTRVAVIVAGQVLAEGTVEEVRGELTLEQRFVELAGGLSDVEGLEWLHTFSD